MSFLLINLLNQIVNLARISFYVFIRAGSDITVGIWVICCYWRMRI
jgi:hypothetical protein